MLSPFLIVTPAHRLAPQLAMAAARAGETGILDLGHGSDRRGRAAALHALARQVRAAPHWGLRWDTLGDAGRAPSCLKEIVGDVKCPVLLLAGVGEETPDLRTALGQAPKEP